MDLARRGFSRGGQAARRGAARTGALPAGPGRIYVGCEAAAMRRIRDYYVKERGVERNTLVTRGYWKLDTANPSDRDYGDEPA